MGVYKDSYSQYDILFIRVIKFDCNKNIPYFYWYDY